ncbi:MAG: type II toxin-antitoxin system RelE/ParE family toxin [Deltaproteobacteria bacterium]|nr:type II toxin-antitoxin system RelE/ParE family toxin [Deltaproteobacteria bacterium]
MYQIEIVPDAVEELKMIPAFHRKRIEQAVEGQLRFEPVKRTKNRKSLEGVVAGFEHEPPLWQLRVGEWRVFYDVDLEEKIVTIRAVREKLPSSRTEDIL